MGTQVPKMGGRAFGRTNTEVMEMKWTKLDKFLLFFGLARFSQLNYILRRYDTLLYKLENLNHEC